MTLSRSAACWAGAVCLALALTACSDQPDERAVTLDDAEETSSGTGFGGGDDDAPEVDIDGAGEPLSEDEAEAALPTVADLPSGWSQDRDQDNEEDEDGEVSPEQCATIFEEFEGEGGEDAAVEVERAFQESDFGPFLSVEIGSYDEPVPDDRFTVITDALDECPEWTETDSEGTETSYTASGLSFPNLGEETLAIRMGMDADGWPASADLVVIRNGHNLVMLVMISIGGQHDVAVLEETARLTMDNLAG